MARIGYARVSTTDQDLTAQLERLAAEGCSVVRSEKVSGGSRDGRVEVPRGRDITALAAGPLF